MTNLEIFATVLVVISAGALGLSVVVEGIRMSAIARQRYILNRHRDSRSTDLARMQRRQEELALETQKRQATIDGMTADCQRVLSLTRSILADRIEMIHELGEPDPGHGLYICPLQVRGDSRRLDQRLPFARDIWQHNNSAHIWAANHDAAFAAVNRAFDSRKGVDPGRVRRADTQPESAGAPPTAAGGRVPTTQRMPERSGAEHMVGQSGAEHVMGGQSGAERDGTDRAVA